MVQPSVPSDGDHALAALFHNLRLMKRMKKVDCAEQRVVVDGRTIWRNQL